MKQIPVETLANAAFKAVKPQPERAPKSRLRLLPGPTSALVLGIIIALVAIVCGIGSAMDNPDTPANSSPKQQVSEAAAAPAGDEVIVHVVGKVATPGLVHLKRGARVDDAIKKVGGVSKGADLAAINLARPLTDGEQIVVPALSQPKSPGTQTAESDCINLNSASEKDLQELNGVGPALAGRIVNHRESQGPFTKVEDLQQVSGIGPALVQKVSGQACV